MLSLPKTKRVIITKKIQKMEQQFLIKNMYKIFLNLFNRYKYNNHYYNRLKRIARTVISIKKDDKNIVKCRSKYEQRIFKMIRYKKKKEYAYTLDNIFRRRNNIVKKYDEIFDKKKSKKY